MKSKSIRAAMAIWAAVVLTCAGSAQAAYWNVFNIEGESVITADFVTYATLSDMLNDTNRTGLFTPNSGGFGRNIVGSGATIAQVHAVPEPETYALMLAGLGLLSFVARRRKQKAA